MTAEHTPIDKQEKAIFEVLNSYVYNDQNQAGDKLIIIDASDLPVIIPEIIEKLKGTTVDEAKGNYDYMTKP